MMVGKLPDIKRSQSYGKEDIFVHGQWY